MEVAEYAKYLTFSNFVCIFTAVTAIDTVLEHTVVAPVEYILRVTMLITTRNY